MWHAAFVISPHPKKKNLTRLINIYSWTAGPTDTFFVLQIQAVVKKYDILFIADEVHNIHPCYQECYV